MCAAENLANATARLTPSLPTPWVDALIVLPCPMQHSMISRLSHHCGHTIICDGAYDMVAGILPAELLAQATVLGDGDSIRRRPAGMQHLADQDTTDSEKALHYAKNQGARTVAIAGMAGNDYHHMWHNVHVLAQHQSSFSSIVIGDQHQSWWVSASGIGTDKAKTLPLGTTVSLFALGGAVTITTCQGLRWQVHGNHHGSISVSNRVNGRVCVTWQGMVAIGTSIALDDCLRHGYAL